jgi:hypothetical protein
MELQEDPVEIISNDEYMNSMVKSSEKKRLCLERLPDSILDKETNPYLETASPMFESENKVVFFKIFNGQMHKYFLQDAKGSYGNHIISCSKVYDNFNILTNKTKKRVVKLPDVEIKTYTNVPPPPTNETFEQKKNNTIREIKTIPGLVTGIVTFTELEMSSLKTQKTTIKLRALLIEYLNKKDFTKDYNTNLKYFEDLDKNCSTSDVDISKYYSWISQKSLNSVGKWLHKEDTDLKLDLSNKNTITILKILYDVTSEFTIDMYNMFGNLAGISSTTPHLSDVMNIVRNTIPVVDKDLEKMQRFDSLSEGTLIHSALEHSIKFGSYNNIVNLKELEDDSQVKNCMNTICTLTNTIELSVAMQNMMLFTIISQDTEMFDIKRGFIHPEDSEILIGSFTYKICGMIDAIFTYYTGEQMILDYKRTKYFCDYIDVSTYWTQSTYKNFFYTNKLLGCATAKSDFVKYSIQMAVYRYLRIHNGFNKMSKNAMLILFHPTIKSAEPIYAQFSLNTHIKSINTTPIALVDTYFKLRKHYLESLLELN